MIKLNNPYQALARKHRLDAMLEKHTRSWKWSIERKDKSIIATDAMIAYKIMMSPLQ